MENSWGMDSYQKLRKIENSFTNNLLNRDFFYFTISHFLFSIFYQLQFYHFIKTKYENFQRS
jgi:hypothetical protein